MGPFSQRWHSMRRWLTTSKVLLFTTSLAYTCLLIHQIDGAPLPGPWVSTSKAVQAAKFEVRGDLDGTQTGISPRTQVITGAALLRLKPRWAHDQDRDNILPTHVEELRRGNDHAYDALLFVSVRDGLRKYAPRSPADQTPPPKTVTTPPPKTVTTPPKNQTTTPPQNQTTTPPKNQTTPPCNHSNDFDSPWLDPGYGNGDYSPSPDHGRRKRRRVLGIHLPEEVSGRRSLEHDGDNHRQHVRNSDYRRKALRVRDEQTDTTPPKNTNDDPPTTHSQLRNTVFRTSIARRWQLVNRWWHRRAPTPVTTVTGKIRPKWSPPSMTPGYGNGDRNATGHRRASDEVFDLSSSKMPLSIRQSPAHEARHALRRRQWWFSKDPLLREIESTTVSPECNSGDVANSQDHRSEDKPSQGARADSLAPFRWYTSPAVAAALVQSRIWHAAVAARCLPMRRDFRKASEIRMQKPSLSTSLSNPQTIVESLVHALQRRTTTTHHNSSKQPWFGTPGYGNGDASPGHRRAGVEALYRVIHALRRRSREADAETIDQVLLRRDKTSSGVVPTDVRKRATSKEKDKLPGYNVGEPPPRVRKIQGIVLERRSPVPTNSNSSADNPPFHNGDWPRRDQSDQKPSPVVFDKRADNPGILNGSNPLNLGQQCQSLLSQYDGSWYNNGDMIMRLMESDKTADLESVCSCLISELAESKKTGAGAVGPRRTSRCLKRQQEAATPYRESSSQIKETPSWYKNDTSTD